ncbi:uncharacterized protein N7459_000170 [Penicillium hispanicum]|uniref:uncharacterized protein n=1 Tax=Penicillium hispanicum TaxID=1080232 RepID=UPI002541ACBD|nr:uncharacterized protein N7459_000170 [Penicillium hispanicum]KAJ5593962.1 hypothetical protein N7459_000170 [Penicillium hispanicum]
MAVPQRTLTWLYSVLSKVGDVVIVATGDHFTDDFQDHYDPKQTYHDPNRAYHDVANALAQYPSLSPRTDVYSELSTSMHLIDILKYLPLLAHENGFSALLLLLAGTLPVAFRGSTYRFPIALWIPNTYPREPPIVYVTPTQDMAVRMGQHVTLEGRVYHHYLAHWAEAWDVSCSHPTDTKWHSTDHVASPLQRSTLTDLLSILRDVFAKEPPVQYRRPVIPPPQPQQTQTPPPLPPLPPSVGHSSQMQTRSPAPTTQSPPQLPSKMGAGAEPQQPLGQPAERYRSPPPLPPLPPKEHDHRRSSGQNYMQAPSQGSRVPHQFSPPQISTQYPAGHPLSPPPQGHEAYNRTSFGPISPITGSQQQYFPRRAEQYPPGLPPQQQPIQQQPPYAATSQHSGYQSLPPQPPPPGPPYPQHSPYPTGYQRPPPAVPAPKNETPDLLTSPFELELPSFTPGPAPPIPPNPEKDALLHAVSKTLAETLQNHAVQSDTAAQSLVAQSHSLQTAMSKLQGEVTALNSLNATLQSNTAVLQQSIHRADATIADAQARSASVQASSAAVASSEPPSGLPPIDEVLVAPTVVGKQLYDLVADEQGLQHALYALQAALVRGVIGVDSWSRHTRGLAREAFLKRALIRKIGRGMGLEETVP